MKKSFIVLAAIGIFAISSLSLIAQDSTASAKTTTAEVTAPVEGDVKSESLFYEIRQQFIEGGPEWMTPILLCLILGLAIAIERIIYLNLSTTNTRKLLKKVEACVETGDFEGAKKVCRNTRGPVASIFYQGLERVHEGIDVVEKSVVSYGSVQTGGLESGLSWLGLFIALAPMLGFMGTVIGMIDAFDSIAKAGDVSPTAVAGGIKVALLTTVGGLIVAVILQIFYNYIVSKIDSLVISMEDASISLLDIITKNKSKI